MGIGGSCPPCESQSYAYNNNKNNTSPDRGKQALYSTNSTRPSQRNTITYHNNDGQGYQQEEQQREAENTSTETSIDSSSRLGKAKDLVKNMGSKAKDLATNMGSKARDLATTMGSKTVNASRGAVGALGNAGSRLLDNAKTAGALGAGVGAGVLGSFIGGGGTRRGKEKKNAPTRKKKKKKTNKAHKKGSGTSKEGCKWKRRREG